MHDHGESGGTIQQMDKGDQTLAFAMRKSRPNHSTTHNRGVTKEDSDGVGTAAAASSLAAHRATPRLRPSPHLHQKEIGKPGALEEEEALLLKKEICLMHQYLRTVFLFSRKKRREKQLLPVQELARHLADKATRFLPPVHQERSRTGPQMTARDHTVCKPRVN